MYSSVSKELVIAFQEPIFVLRAVFAERKNEKFVFHPYENKMRILFRIISVKNNNNNNFDNSYN